MYPELLHDHVQARMADRRALAHRRRLLRAQRIRRDPWRSRAGMWLVGIGLALVARASRPEMRPHTATGLPHP